MYIHFDACRIKEYRQGKPNQNGTPGSHYLTVEDADGEYSLQAPSNGVDLSVLPRGDFRQLVDITAKVGGAIYRGKEGSRQVLKVLELKCTALPGAPASGSAK